MELKSRYVNADEFFRYSGIDLNQHFSDNDNPSAQVDGFIFRIETLLENWINAHFFKLIDDEFAKFSERQKRLYKIALMEQMIYVLRNGDITTDSGYNMTSGKIADTEYINKVLIARNTLDALKSAGIITTKIRTGFGHYRGGFGGLFF